MHEVYSLFKCLLILIGGLQHSFR